MTICHAKQEDEKELVFKFGFIEQFEPIGNLLCDPHPSPAVGGRHLPPGEGKHEEMGAFPHRKNYVFLLVQYKRSPILSKTV